MSRRTERVGSLIRQEVAEAILRDLDDPRLEGVMASVNRVKVSDDLGTADIYMVLMGSEGKQTAALAALQHAAGLMRSRVGKALSTRTIPYLRFHIDEAYRREIEVLELIRKAELERKAKESDEAEGLTDELEAPEEPGVPGDDQPPRPERG